MSKRVVALLCLALCLLQGCGEEPAVARTLVGGSSGVGLEFAPGVTVRSGDVDVRVCDAEGCATATQVFPELAGGGSSFGRSTQVSFTELGRTFSPGDVTVTIRLHGPEGELVAKRTGDVELTRSFPNGRACDGDGFVNGLLKLDKSDRV